jgi:hypothetical protein
MKKLILVVVLILTSILFAEDIYEQIQQLKQFQQLEFDASFQEKERDTKIKEITTSPRGEFETTAMYNKRKKDAGRIAEEIRTEYAGKIADVKRKFDNCQREIENEILQLVASSREDVECKFTVGKYDADNANFTIIMSETNKTYRVNVPLSLAQNFKQNANKLRAIGQRQLTENGNWEYFNWQINFSGQTFAFGETKGKSSNFVASTTNVIPPNLSVQLAFSEPSGDDRLDAEETAELVVTIKNKGAGSAFGVEILCNLSGSYAVNYPKSVYIGEIPSNQSRTRRLKFSASESVSSGEVAVSLQFQELNHFEPNDQKIAFETEALIPPKLAIVDIGIDDWSKNAKIETGETVSITVRIQNLGNGSADNVKAKINNESANVFFFGDSQENFNLGTLAPGEFKDFSFDLVSNKKAKEMPISVTVTESRGRFGVSNYSLDLAFNQVQQSVGEMMVVGKYEQKDNFEVATGLSIDIEKNIPQAKNMNEDALAIIFGIEQYKNVSNVTFAKRDASIMKEYFVKTLGIPANQIYFQTDDDVGKAEFDKVFSKNGWLDKRTSAETDIFIYFAGHGAPDIKEKSAYLIPYDGDPNYASQTGFSIDEMYAGLNKLNAKSVTVFIDACFSGANRESEMLLADARPISVEVECPSAYGINVFSASSGSQISSAYPQKKHGLFTYFLLKGMQGEADANSDRKITVGELGNYVNEKVSRQAGFLDREQTPQLQSIQKDEVLIKF